MSAQIRTRGGRPIIFLVLSLIVSSRTFGDDCYRYVSGASTSISINETCVQQLGVTPIFVQERSSGGFDLIVPTTTAPGEPWNSLRAAARQWLADAAHRSSTYQTVTFAANASQTAPIVVNGGITPIEYINYELASWLNSSGATSAINALATAPTIDLTECSHITVCTSCQIYWCGDGQAPGGMKCFCDQEGQSCCVISH